ncbi:helix-turn-helix domain-containing protein [Haliangium sp.]
MLADIVRGAVRAEVRAILDEELVDVHEAAQLLQMTEGAVRKAVERGQVPCTRVGRRLRFRRSELLRIAAL